MVLVTSVIQGEDDESDLGSAHCVKNPYLHSPVEVSALAPADLIAPSPRSYHTYYTPSPTYGNFRFIRGQELIEIQSS